MPGTTSELRGHSDEELVHPPAGEELPEEPRAALAEDGHGRQMSAHRLDHRAGGDLARLPGDGDPHPRVHHGEPCRPVLGGDDQDVARRIAERGGGGRQGAASAVQRRPWESFAEAGFRCVLDAAR